MACGKPVIGTRAGGIHETISNDNVGILVEPAHPMALTSAILEALDRKWESKSILNHAKKYRWSYIAKQIISVYENISS
jgi:D-inositol-3-phosphate glycosyltransferase